MDLAKFLSLLSSRALWFGTPASMEDPWEGHSPLLNAAHGEFTAALNRSQLAPLVPFAKLIPELKQVIDNMNNVAFGPRTDLAMNCWHTSEHESDALWKVYGQAIVVKSSFGRLAESFARSPRNVMIGKVLYGDPKFAVDPFQRVLVKRPSFEHEKEIRAVIAVADPRTGAKVPFATEFGEPVPVKLEVLVDDVVVAPTAPLWFAEVVRTTIEKFGFAFPCRKSDLLSSPRGLGAPPPRAALT